MEAAKLTNPSDKLCGISITWMDLWVTVSNRWGDSRPLLQGLSGYAEPGSVMAILGPSGSGKTLLLDALARRLGSNLKQSGKILVNGRRQSFSYCTSAYVTQDDILMATLTVREAILYAAQLQLPDTMSIHEKTERAEATIKEMGLQNSVNTRIGGWRARGLSGGEARRVSIAIEIIRHPQVLFLDEPTSNLDSAAAYHVMNRLHHLARDGRTVIASIHQPSGDVFELFTHLCILSRGQEVYFGPTSGAAQFFALNGFPCPTMRNPCEHYLTTINSDFERDIEEGDPKGRTQAEHAIKSLVNAYKSSEEARIVATRINQLANRKCQLLDSSYFSGTTSFSTQVHFLTRRSFKNMYRDLGYYWLRFGINVTLCLCVGTIFYKVGTSFNSIQARAAMLFFLFGFLTFMSIGGFPAFVEEFRVFERERLNGHYEVYSFIIANTLSSIPFLILISAFPGAIAYFLTDLHRGIGHFVYFTLALFACMLLVESLMMAVACVVPDFLLGIIVGAGIQGIFLLTGGFVRLPNDLPKPLWRYPVSFISFSYYANQAFYKNEFRGLIFDNSVTGAPPLSGDYILQNNFQVTSYSKWLDLAVLLTLALLYRLFFFAIITTKEKVGPVIRHFLSRHHNSEPSEKRSGSTSDSVAAQLKQLLVKVKTVIAHAKAES